MGNSCVVMVVLNGSDRYDLMMSVILMRVLDVVGLCIR